MWYCLFIALVILASPNYCLGGSLSFERSRGISREDMTRNPQSSFQLLDPKQFSMEQSYSMTYTSSSQGSQSSGLYLNTLSYTFGFPLTFSVDIGAYNLFYSEMKTELLIGDRTNDPKFIIPRVGLEYRPNDNLLLSLQLFRGPDAMRAYSNQRFFSSYGTTMFRRQKGR